MIKNIKEILIHSFVSCTNVRLTKPYSNTEKAFIRDLCLFRNNNNNDNDNGNDKDNDNGNGNDNDNDNDKELY